MFKYCNNSLRKWPLDYHWAKPRDIANETGKGRGVVREEGGVIRCKIWIFK